MYLEEARISGYLQKSLESDQWLVYQVEGGKESANNQFGYFEFIHAPFGIFVEGDDYKELRNPLQYLLPHILEYNVLPQIIPSSK